MTVELDNLQPELLIPDTLLIGVSMPSRIFSQGLKLKSEISLLSLGNKMRLKMHQYLSRLCTTPRDFPNATCSGSDASAKRHLKFPYRLSVLHPYMQLYLMVASFVLSQTMPMRSANANASLSIKDTCQIGQQHLINCHVGSPETWGEFGESLLMLQWKFSIYGNAEPSAKCVGSNVLRRCNDQRVRSHANTPSTSAPRESEDMIWTAWKHAEAHDKHVRDNIIRRFYQEAITIPVTDTLLNAGSGKVVDLVMAKNEIAMGSLLQKLSRGVYGVAPQNTSIDLDGIPTALAGSGSYAGIPLGGFWLCNGGAGPSSGSALSISNMMADYGSAVYGNEEPDTIITTQAGWNAFFNLLIGQQRYQRDEDTTRAGFRHLMFNQSKVLHDQFVPAGEMEFLTSKYVKAVFHQNDYFSVDPFIQPTNQRVLSSHIWTTMNLQFVTLRQHARRTGITNA